MTYKIYIIKNTLLNINISLKIFNLRKELHNIKNVIKIFSEYLHIYVFS